MLNDRGFFGPTQYQWWVVYLLIGMVLLALIAAWYIFVVRFSRTRVPPVAVAAPRRLVELGILRPKYLAMIDEVQYSYAAGDLSERAVHSRLSLLLRFFAFEAQGVDAQVMTLSDLRDAQLPAVTGAVEQYYPPAFKQQTPGDPHGAVETARRVVTTWN